MVAYKGEQAFSPKGSQNSWFLYSCWCNHLSTILAECHSTKDAPTTQSPDRTTACCHSVAATLSAFHGRRHSTATKMTAFVLTRVFAGIRRESGSFRVFVLVEGYSISSQSPK